MAGCRRAGAARRKGVEGESRDDGKPQTAWMHGLQGMHLMQVAAR